MRVNVATFATLAGFAFAADAAQYEDCVGLAEVDPHRAMAEAERWHSETGDPAALHCRALALEEAGALRNAADLLMQVAEAPELSDEGRAAVLGQAARIWREVGQSGAARAALDAAVRLAPNPALLVERASLHAEAEDWTAAREDLDSAIRDDPQNAAALTLRAAAERKLGDLEAARADALRAIELRPVSSAAWFELGMAERAMGLNDGARRSWLKAIDLAPEGPAAAMARGELQDMDGGD